MKHTLKLYYSVQNGGDGSAYPQFMSCGKLAEYDQENMNESWGESCTGSITLESDSPIEVKEKIETPESYLINLIDNDADEDCINQFVAEFFPNGRPVFEVQTRPTGDKKYLNNDVFLDGKKIASVWQSVKNSGEPFKNKLNK